MAAGNADAYGAARAPMMANEVADFIVAVRDKVVFVSWQAKIALCFAMRVITETLRTTLRALYAFLDHIETWSFSIATSPPNASLINGGVDSGSLQCPGVLLLSGCTHLGNRIVHLGRMSRDGLQISCIGSERATMSSVRATISLKVPRLRRHLSGLASNSSL
jgi:hypothetical protein